MIVTDPENPDCITDDGILVFCEQLQLDPQDPVILVLSWYMEAETMCTYTREEFRRGMTKLDCETTNDLHKTLPMLRQKLQNCSDFTRIYSVR